MSIKTKAKNQSLLPTTVLTDRFKGSDNKSSQLITVPLQHNIQTISLYSYNRQLSTTFYNLFQNIIHIHFYYINICVCVNHSRTNNIFYFIKNHFTIVKYKIYAYKVKVKQPALPPKQKLLLKSLSEILNIAVIILPPITYTLTSLPKLLQGFCIT